MILRQQTSNIVHGSMVLQLHFSFDIFQNQDIFPGDSVHGCLYMCIGMASSEAGWSEVPQAASPKSSSSLPSLPAPGSHLTCPPAGFRVMELHGCAARWGSFMTSSWDIGSQLEADCQHCKTETSRCVQHFTWAEGTTTDYIKVCLEAGRHHKFQ